MKKLWFRMYVNSPMFIKNILRYVHRVLFAESENKKESRRISKYLRNNIKKYSVHGREIFIELRNGLKFFVPITDRNLQTKPLNQENLFLFSPIVFEFPEIIDKGVYEKYFSIKKGQIIVDAGANVGIFTIKASKLVGPKGKVIAIEPEKKNMMLLKRNARINNCRNIIFAEKAMSDSNGTARLFLEESATHSMLMHDSRQKHATKHVTIDTRILSKILHDAHVRNIDLLKMDIEGAEILAIRGALPYLRNRNIVLSIAAYHYVDGTHTYKLLVPMLKSLGYNVQNSELPFIYAEKPKN